jgi:hypothetical protein
MPAAVTVVVLAVLGLGGARAAQPSPIAIAERLIDHEITGRERTGGALRAERTEQAGERSASAPALRQWARH